MFLAIAFGIPIKSLPDLLLIYLSQLLQFYANTNHTLRSPIIGNFFLLSLSFSLMFMKHNIIPSKGGSNSSPTQRTQFARLYLAYRMVLNSSI
jgi:hypothetical protein